MSYKIVFTNRAGDQLNLEILEREEYSKLSDTEKIAYSASPNIDDYNELGVQEFIWGIIEANDTGDFGLPEILDSFMKKHFPDIFNEWIARYGDNKGDLWSDRTDYFWSILDEKAEQGECDADELDPLDLSDIFFLNYAYDSDYIYELIENECKRLKA